MSMKCAKKCHIVASAEIPFYNGKQGIEGGTLHWEGPCRIILNVETCSK